ncbi:326_t:CDS:2 [Cetraspora pellucida]|uniref:326_t:CDS:1 n=1 Tax=Cetraspora pellucida TaxID=1433469 RepID=A0ACA9LGH9_9GLOM|nr:326_t:CDS:2 [Cetraspora pellucida]
MVMILADYEDLSAYLQKNFSTLTYIKKLKLLYDIAAGLIQVHKPGLVHHDLHCDNVICQGITDRSLGRGKEYRFIIGTPNFEIFNSLNIDELEVTDFLDNKDL